MTRHPRQGHTDRLHLAHHHPGRLRLRSDALVDGGSGRADAARAALGATAGVLFVGHDAGTGSLLIEYEVGAIEPDAVIERVARATGLDFEGRLEVLERALGHRLIQKGREVNAAVYELTGRRADLRTLLPAAVAGLSAAVLVSGEGGRLPRWDNLAYWSFNLFALLHVREINAPESDPETAAARATR